MPTVLRETYPTAKKEGWINIYETVSERCIGAVHKSKEEAMRVKVNEKVLHTKIRLE